MSLETQISVHFLANEKAKSEVSRVWERELERRSLLQNAQLLRHILNQQAQIDGQSTKETQEKTSAKQDLNRVLHDKKLLESKVGLLTTEIENWKKKSSNQSALQKETMTQKNQITKLNSQLNEARNEVNKVKQQFVTQKAVLESKLENAKKSIKNLKEAKTGATSISSKPINPLISPSKPTNKEQLPLKRPLVSNFSVSPFLAKTTKAPLSPSKNPKAHPLSNVASSTPTQITGNNVLAQSTPGGALVSPLKNMKSHNSKSSGLKNLLSPAKESSGQAKLKPKPKKSLFDVDEDEDDDLFGDSIRKVKKEIKDKKDEEAEADNTKANETVSNPGKKRKRKVGSKAIVEDDEHGDEAVKFSPLKKVKLMDKLGGISPLKQRNKERNLFKV